MKPHIPKLVVLFVMFALIIAPLNAMQPAQAAPQSSVMQQGQDSDQEPDSSLDVSHRLIVELESAPLSVYLRETRSGLQPSGRLDFQAAPTQAYLAQLEAEQDAFINNMQAAVPGAQVDSYINEAGQSVDLTYQVVYNGMVINPGQNNLHTARKALLTIPGVKAVYYDYVHYPHLYASLPLINAPTLWETSQIGGQENAGEGIIIASMDGGIHRDAPMFDGTGWSYPPGWPEGGLGLTANNNGKIIASRVYFRSWDPPVPGDDTPWPGAQGTSHGVHTAGIAAGNPVEANYLGATENISGVAPAAWVMSYRVFYVGMSGIQSFYTGEGIAALEDVVRDGADVVNNSWGGGPGSAGGPFDPLDQALINASNAGVFVSMSAGNAGPGAGTTDHPSPEYISVAASTTTGTYAAGFMDVVAPEPVPASLQDMPFAQAGFGAALPLASTLNHNFVTAASVDPANAEGCTAWEGTPFEGVAVLIMRGTCEFGVKVLNAENAGAEFVVVYNHETGGDELINMGPGVVGDQVTIGSVFIGYTHGAEMVDWYTTNGADSEFQISTVAQQVGNDPDIIIDFSSRGPGVGYVAKPDITAPGVNILSQGYAPGATGEERHLGFGQVSGTSMAAPHVAGGAALLRQYHPDWSNMDIKSALMTTSRFMGIYMEDGTHAQPLDMGAGRMDLASAYDPGVLLSPPSLGYGLMTEGITRTLTVSVTSVATTTETYALSTALISGTVGSDPDVLPLPGFTISPTSLTLGPGETTQVTIDFDSAQGVVGEDNQGYIIMEGTNYDAHFSVWARVAPESTADVLLIDNDGSSSFGFPDYQDYYTSVLDELGLTYDVWDADANFGNPTTIPHAAVLAAYPIVIYFTGDNFYPNGTATVTTAPTELDMDRLTEYANGGGILIAMGQDMAAVLQSAVTDSNTFFYGSVLGGNWLQDTLTGEELPELDIVAMDNAPAALQAIVLDLGPEGDGAANQIYIDEIMAEPFYAPDNPEELVPYQPLLRYPGPFNEEIGVVGMAHRDQPTLERAGTTYSGRSIYTTFGLEGVNNTEATTSRAELIDAFLSWAMDEPEAEIVVSSTSNPSFLTTFEVNFTSNITGTTAVAYRWDFGDGSEFTEFFNDNVAGHTYEECGIHTVRVEVLDSYGNRIVESSDVDISQCTSPQQQGPYVINMPLIHREQIPAEPGS
jgi:subtilisin family serine protease